MKVDLDGTFDVTTSPESTFAFLTDPERFAPLLPYFKELKNVQPEVFTVGLEVGVPQIRGHVDVQVKLVEKTAPTSAIYKSSGRHSLGIVDSDLSFTIRPNAGGATVDWRSSSVVNGTLASLAQGILVPLAKRQIKLLVRSCQDQLGTTEPQPSESVLKRGVTSIKGMFRSGGAAS